MPYSDDELRKRIENLERIVVAMASGGHFAMTIDDVGRPAIVVGSEQFAGLPAHHQARTVYVPPTVNK